MRYGWLNCDEEQHPLTAAASALYAAQYPFSFRKWKCVETGGRANGRITAFKLCTAVSSRTSQLGACLHKLHGPPPTNTIIDFRAIS